MRRRMKTRLWICIARGGVLYTCIRGLRRREENTYTRRRNFLENRARIEKRVGGEGEKGIVEQFRK